MRCRLEGAVLDATQRGALRAASLEHRLQATASQLAAAQLAAPSASASAGAEAPPLSSRQRAASAAPNSQAAATAAASPAQSADKQRPPRPDDWVSAMLEAALHTPLPDAAADVLEDDAPAQLLEQIAELEAADGSGGGGGGPAGAGAADGFAAAAATGAVPKALQLTGEGSGAALAELLLAALEGKVSRAAAAVGEPHELSIPAHRPAA